MVEMMEFQEFSESDCLMSDSDHSTWNLQDRYEEEITMSVRKELAPALRDLIQHGLMPVSRRTVLFIILNNFHNCRFF